MVFYAVSLIYTAAPTHPPFPIFLACLGKVDDDSNPRNTLRVQESENSSSRPKNIIVLVLPQSVLFL